MDPVSMYNATRTAGPLLDCAGRGVRSAANAIQYAPQHIDMETAVFIAVSEHATISLADLPARLAAAADIAAVNALTSEVNKLQGPDRAAGFKLVSERMTELRKKAG